MTLRQSRRQFLVSAAAFPFALRSFAEPGAHAPRWIILGSGTDKGIFRAAWDAQGGELSAIEPVAEAQHPSYLALHPTLPLLYAVNEIPEGNGLLSSYRVDRESASLTPLHQVSTGGNGPCFVSIDQTGHAAFVANYGGGSFAAFNLDHSGAPRTPPAKFDCRKNAACGEPGPNRERQDTAHMHCATVSPDNRFVLACNLGEDAIEIFPLHPMAADPVEAPVRIAARAGSGPRHLAFHPNGRWLYCIHELDCTIDLYEWNVSNGQPEPVLRKDSVISTLSTRTALPGSTACELHVSPDGKFLYGNTRGEDSLCVYRVDASTGLLSEQQRIYAGKSTRYFTFDPTRRWLLCANQGGSNITVFDHEPSTGRLGKTPRTFAMDTPMFIQFL